MRSILAIALAFASFALGACSGADVGHIDPASAPETTDAEGGAPVRGAALPEGDGGGEAALAPTQDAPDAPDAGGDGAIACHRGADCPASDITGTGHQVCDSSQTCFEPVQSPPSLLPQGCVEAPVASACSVLLLPDRASAYEAVSCDPSVLITHVGDKTCSPADPSRQADGGATLYCCHY